MERKPVSKIELRTPFAYVCSAAKPATALSLVVEDAHQSGMVMTGARSDVVSLTGEIGTVVARVRRTISFDRLKSTARCDHYYAGSVKKLMPEPVDNARFGMTLECESLLSIWGES